MSTTSSDAVERLVVERHHRLRYIDREPVRYGCVAVVEVPGQAAEPARVELVGGRHRHSVGGQIAEGPRWWRGQLDRTDGVPLRTGTTIQLELANGRRAAAVVEASSPSAPYLDIRGLGAPPFEVP